MTSKTNGNPADSKRMTPENAAAAESTDTGEAGIPQDDPTAQLRIELAAAKTELDRCQDRFLRKAAEFDNYRKRMDREKTETALQAKSAILVEFLPVADACERALTSLGKESGGTETLEHYREGVRLLYKQIHDVLSRIGVLPIDAQGRPFDPHLHEAVTREESSEHEENTVLLELRRGYLYRDRLLRPAQVKVSARPQNKDTDRS